MKQIILTLTILFFISLSGNSIHSQVSEQWASRYSFTGGTDKANAMAIDASGNVYVTGSSVSGGYRTEDYCTIKYNSSGTAVWTKRYNGTGTGYDVAYAIAVDASGNVYVTGSSTAGNDYEDYLTIKYNSAGDTIWTQRYNGSRNKMDIAYSITVDASGNVYVTGSSEGTIGTHGIFEDYVTVKYNSSGVQQWANSYNGPGGDFDAAYSIAVDGTGNVYVTGTSGGGSGGSGLPYQDYATVKYNAAGVFQWVARYNGTASSADDKANMLKLDASGNVYVTGKGSMAGTSYDYVTIKYSTAGTLMWTGIYNGTGSSTDEAASLDVDRSGNVYVTGVSYTGAANGNDIVTVKYNSLGVQQWANSYNGSANSNDGGKSIQVDTASNVYVTGYSTGAITSLDYATVKYNSAGTLLWSIRYTNSNSPGSDDTPACLKADNSGNVYVTGMSSLDYATVKYSPAATNVNNVSAETPGGYSLNQNFPNPFNPNTIISFSIVDSRFVELKVFDILGKEVSTVVNEQLQPGNYHVEFDANALPSGIYFSKIRAGEFTDTKKMMLIK